MTLMWQGGVYCVRINSIKKRQLTSAVLSCLISLYLNFWKVKVKTHTLSMIADAIMKPVVFKNFFDNG